jgi:hypothetical protein
MLAGEILGRTAKLASVEIAEAGRKYPYRPAKVPEEELPATNCGAVKRVRSSV